MSLKNIYTTNLKQYQNIKINSIEAKNAKFDTLDINDLSANHIKCNSVNFTTSQSPSIDLALNIYSTISLEMNYTIFGLTGAPFINGIEFIRMGFLVVCRQLLFSIAGNGLSGSDSNVITSMFEVPEGYRPNFAQDVICTSNCQEYTSVTEIANHTIYYYWDGVSNTILIFKSDNSNWRKADDVRINLYGAFAVWVVN